MQPNRTLDPSRDRTVRLRGPVMVLCVALLALIMAATVQAHVGSISIDCAKVVFNFTKFPSGESRISYSIGIDGHTTAGGTFTVRGSSDSHLLINPIQGNHEVSAEASWAADGGGSAHASTSVRCAAPAVQPAPVLQPTPAPASAPAPAPVSAPAPTPTPVPVAEVPPAVVNPGEPPTPPESAPANPASGEAPTMPAADPRTSSTRNVPVAPRKPRVISCAGVRKRNTPICHRTSKRVSSARIGISTTMWVGVRASRQTINLPFTR
jgi:hypothetical protein